MSAFRPFARREAGLFGGPWGGDQTLPLQSFMVANHIFHIIGLRG
ncbi:MAG: hypothetical protein AAFR73_13460 [Pseudomonadota bacterium]